jgi:cytochrome c oxidase assembly protein subunit 15/protoheme IX farnesyltransferase
VTLAASDLLDERGTASSERRRFERLAWLALLYTVGVVLFGAVVRITGSGAGCGQHWPTCHGEVAHLPRSVETAIELTHRVTSGLSLVVVVAVWWTARRRFPQGSATRFWSGASVLLMVVESLIGAALVLLALVGNNDSVWRAVVMSLHLVNTSLLLGAMALTAWSARRTRAPAALRPTPLTIVGFVAVLAVSVTGAVTALGDTLYPALDAPALARVAADQADSAHFLQRLRILHPTLAVCAGLYLLYLAARLTDERAPRSVRLWSNALRLAVVLQLGAGFVNVWLSAPGYMQVVHLALATALWLCLVMLSAETALRQAPN